MQLADQDYAEAAAQVAHAIGERGRPVSFGEEPMHPVFRVGAVVVRIEVAEVAADVACRVEQCCRMRGAAVPFVVPAVDSPVPVPGCDGLLATVWEYVEPRPPLDWAALGAAVAELHAFDGLAIPSSSLTEELARAIAGHPSLDDAVAERFRLKLSEVEETLAAVGWPDLPVAASHGDLWTKNVIPRGPGGVVLCDPDFLGVRPTAFDLGLLFRETNGDERWAQFVNGYGNDRIPPAVQLRAAFFAAMANWATYVLDRRRDWVDYTDELSKAAYPS